MEMSGLSPPPSSAAMSGMALSSSTCGLEEEGDEAEDERVEGHGLGEREAEPLDARDLLAHLRLAGDRLDHLSEDEADADAGADRAQARADAERDGLETVVRDLCDGECDVEHLRVILLEISDLRRSPRRSRWKPALRR